MWFFITMLICNLLMPLIMIIGGYYMYKNPPKEINDVMGYRTKRAKKNKDTWTFAHDCCGRLWIKLGLVLFSSTVIVQMLFLHADEDTIGIMTLIVESVQLGVMLGSIRHVDNELKRTFDHNGIRKI